MLATKQLAKNLIGDQQTSDLLTVKKKELVRITKAKLEVSYSFKGGN